MGWWNGWNIEKKLTVNAKKIFLRAVNNTQRRKGFLRNDIF
jgi:hypothetical protein